MIQPQCVGEKGLQLRNWVRRGGEKGQDFMRSDFAARTVSVRGEAVRRKCYVDLRLPSEQRCASRPDTTRQVMLLANPYGRRNACP